MKKIFFYFLLPFSFMALFAQQTPQQYKIQSASYMIEGMTREYALKIKVKIDYGQIFYSEESLKLYIRDLDSQFTNLRQLESVTIRTAYLDPQEDGIIPVVLFITTKDSWNIFPLPYPRYDSNDGLDLKIKIKDFNFLGSLNTLDGQLIYKYDEDFRHIIGAGISFDYPFAMKNLEATWNNSIDLYYVIGEYFTPTISTGLSFSLPLGLHSIDFGFKQGFNYDPKEYPGNSAYFTEQLFINFPICIANIENWGKVQFVPGISFTQNWGTDAFKNGWDGITHPDLKGPVLNPSYSISTSRVNWVDNYRNGASFSFSNSYAYNFYEQRLKPSLNINITLFKAFKYGSISGRLIWISNMNDTFDIGGYMRGVRDDRVEELPTAFIFNFDAPIKVFSTNWVKWGLWDWTKYLDFELQLSPFVDGALTFGQGLRLSGGLEVLVFPLKMRSIVVRGSIGFEALPWKGVVGTIKAYEIFIGIGLFY